MEARLPLPWTKKMRSSAAFKLIRILGVSSIGALAPAANGYDRTAHIGANFISAPFSVTSASQCRALSERLESKRVDIVAAHDMCLNQEGSEGYRSFNLDSKSKCEKPACQSLHDGRDSFATHSQRENSKCQSLLSEYESKEKAAADAKRAKKVDEDLARANASPCEKEWQQYEAVCSGNHDTASDQRTCRKELTRLRSDCRR